MMKPKPLRKSEYETLAAFRLALRQFAHFSGRAAETAGITGQQYQALLAIKGFPGRKKVSVGELAEQLQLRHHSTVELVDRMVKERLVTRTPSPADRRWVRVQLNARGEKILEKLASVHREQLKRIGPDIRQLLERVGGTREED